MLRLNSVRDGAFSLLIGLSALPNTLLHLVAKEHVQHRGEHKAGGVGKCHLEEADVVSLEHRIDFLTNFFSKMHVLPYQTGMYIVHDMQTASRVSLPFLSPNSQAIFFSSSSTNISSSSILPTNLFCRQHIKRLHDLLTHGSALGRRQVIAVALGSFEHARTSCCWPGVCQASPSSAEGEEDDAVLPCLQLALLQAACNPGQRKQSKRLSGEATPNRHLGDEIRGARADTPPRLSLPEIDTAFAP